MQVLEVIVLHPEHLERALDASSDNAVDLVVASASRWENSSCLHVAEGLAKRRAPFALRSSRITCSWQSLTRGSIALYMTSLTMSLAATRRPVLSSLA